MRGEFAIINTMNKKITLASILVGIVILGTTITLARAAMQSQMVLPWVPPEKSFPDLGGMHPPLDEGDVLQYRAGTIDFSASPAKATMLFGANQGININTSFGANGLFNLFFGDLKIANLGNGLMFSGSSEKQITAMNGLYGLGKVCNVLGSGWSNNIVVPDSWAVANCNTFATSAKGTNYQIGCALPNGIAFGTAGGGVPNPDCGWGAVCASSGSYYPSAPTNGCLTPQKVIAAANQASVTSGVDSVTITPTKTTTSAGSCWHFITSLNDCTTTSCSLPITVNANNFSCGAFISDGVADSGTCGTGKTYQVYCR